MGGGGHRATAQKDTLLRRTERGRHSPWRRKGALSPVRWPSNTAGLVSTKAQGARHAPWLSTFWSKAGVHQAPCSVASQDAHSPLGWTEEPDSDPTLQAGKTKPGEDPPGWEPACLPNLPSSASSKTAARTAGRPRCPPSCRTTDLSTSPPAPGAALARAGELPRAPEQAPTPALPSCWPWQWPREGASSPIPFNR